MIFLRKEEKSVSLCFKMIILVREQKMNERVSIGRNLQYLLKGYKGLNLGKKVKFKEEQLDFRDYGIGVVKVINR